MSKATIASDVLGYPDIDGNNADVATFVDALVDRAVDLVAGMIGRPRYPFQAQGQLVGKTGASKSITTLATNEILVNVDFVGSKAIALDLAGLNSGSAIAAELQAKIRAAKSSGDIGYDSWSRVTVTFTDGSDDFYTATSPTYGPQSSVSFGYELGVSDVAYELRLSKDFGAVGTTGEHDDARLDSAVVMLVVNEYRKTRLQPEIYEATVEYAMTRAFEVIDPAVRSIIASRARFNY
jgi:hypothetical protein